MDYNTVFAICKEEAAQGPLLIFVAVGCAVGYYPDDEHPAQQYPPYLLHFSCRQICILIDPALELPPRSLADVAKLPVDVLIVPLQEYLHSRSEPSVEGSHGRFLDSLARLCLQRGSETRMIVADYTGRDCNREYPFHLANEESEGYELFKKVLYDPTYGEGGCRPDLDAITILHDEHGDFLQPRYLRFQDMKESVPKEIFMKQWRDRKYPIVHILAHQYRIQRQLEVPRDWLTDEMVGQALQQISHIYGSDSLQIVLPRILDDLCAISHTHLEREDILAIVESPGNEFENMWNMVQVLLD